MQVASNESKNLLAMFLRDGEFYIVTVSHFVAKKARDMMAHALFKDPFQSADDNACKGREDKVCYIFEFTARSMDHNV